jgi:hypothetical protein
MIYFNDDNTAAVTQLGTVSKSDVVNDVICKARAAEQEAERIRAKLIEAEHSDFVAPDRRAWGEAAADSYYNALLDLFEEIVGLMLKDMDAVADLAQTSECNLPLMNAARKVYP